jgi:hypothetical protein
MEIKIRRREAAWDGRAELVESGLDLDWSPHIVQLQTIEPQPEAR